MPRGRPRNNPVPELTPEEQNLREQTPPVEPQQETPGAEQTGTGETPTQEEQALREQTSPAEPELEGPGAEQTTATVKQAVTDEPRQQESPETLLGYMAENFREDIRSLRFLTAPITPEKSRRSRRMASPFPETTAITHTVPVR